MSVSHSAQRRSMHFVFLESHGEVIILTLS